MLINNPVHYEECRYVTLFFEAVVGHCRTAVPVVCLLTLANHGADLVWGGVATSITQWDATRLETGNEVISPWQTGK